MMFRVCTVCPYVCHTRRHVKLARSHVCTYGAILRIRRTEEYQSVGNKQAKEKQSMCVLCVLLLNSRIDRYQSQ